MGKKTPSPPPAPDYAAAATAQGTANRDAALQGSYLSNPNIVSPYGNQTVTWASDPDDPLKHQATVTQTLTPAAQAALDAQQQVQLSESGLAKQGIDKAAGLLGGGFTYNGPSLHTSMGDTGGIDSGPAGDAFGSAKGIDGAAYGRALRSADTSDVAAMPVNAGMTGQAAIMSRLAPQMEQTRAATAQRLANQGIPVGSEAWTNEMRQQGQDFNDAYIQAAAKGVDLDMSANRQGFDESMQKAGLYNTGLAQDFGQGLQGQQLTNSAVGQNFGQAVTSTNLHNQAEAQRFNEDQSRFNTENAARQSDWQQQLAQYNQPLNQVTALMSGSQIQNPQFQAYQGQNVTPAPIFQGSQAQGQYDMDAYGQQMAAYNAKMQALGSGLGAAATFIPGFGKSDYRLKDNITRVGEHPLGIGIYEYDIEGRRERGVMAHELYLVKPEAVAIGPDGYFMVDYHQLEAA
jgi:hypothetical protein